MRKLDHDQIAMCCHSLNGLVMSEEGATSLDVLREDAQTAEAAGAPTVTVTLTTLRSALNASQRPFTKDEESRFIDRLVWAIGASPGGRLDGKQKAEMLLAVSNVLASCARTSNPEEIIATRLVDMIEEQMAKLDAVPLQFNDFQKRCRGEQV